MTTEGSDKVVALLQEIHEGQKQQLAYQLEAIELQRKQFTVFQEQAARAERIQQKAELLQDRGASLVRGARKAVLVIVPVVIVLVLYLSWLLFRWRY